MDLQQSSLNHYQSYLLRIWQDEPHEAENSPWRFSLEDPRTGVRRGFQDLELMMTFLSTQLEKPRSQ